MRKITSLLFLITALSVYGVTANKVWRVGTTNGPGGWGAVKLDSTAAVTGTLPVTNGGTGTTTSTGTGSVVRSASPTVTGTLTAQAVTASGLLTASAGTLGSDGTADATAGNVGEYVEATDTSHPSMIVGSNVYQECASISLTAGDWDISMMADIESRGGSSLTIFSAGIGTAAGASSTGLVFGSNALQVDSQTAMDTGKEMAITISPYRVRIAATTTYYAKIKATFTSTPKYDCRISARRVR